MTADTAIVAHRQRGRIDKGDARTAAFPCVQIAAQWHHRSGHQLDETTVADQGREVRARVCGYVLGVVIEFIPFSFWYDAPLTSPYSDRRHDPWPVYGSPSCSPVRWSFWMSRA